MTFPRFLADPQFHPTLAWIYGCLSVSYPFPPVSYLQVERLAEKEPWGDDLYFCTFSNQVIVYKGMLRSVVLRSFYLDLQDERYESAFAIYHRRFSTNTTPKWPLAQPMRFLGHNGEINTLQVRTAAVLVYMF